MQLCRLCRLPQARRRNAQTEFRCDAVHKMLDYCITNLNSVRCDIRLTEDIERCPSNAVRAAGSRQRRRCPAGHQQRRAARSTEQEQQPPAAAAQAAQCAKALP